MLAYGRALAQYQASPEAFEYILRAHAGPTLPDAHAAVEYAARNGYAEEPPPPELVQAMFRPDMNPRVFKEVRKISLQTEEMLRADHATSCPCCREKCVPKRLCFPNHLQALKVIFEHDPTDRNAVLSLVNWYLRNNNRVVQAAEVYETALRRTRGDRSSEGYLLVQLDYADFQLEHMEIRRDVIGIYRKVFEAISAAKEDDPAAPHIALRSLTLLTKICETPMTDTDREAMMMYVAELASFVPSYMRALRDYLITGRPGVGDTLRFTALMQAVTEAMTDPSRTLEVVEYARQSLEEMPDSSIASFVFGRVQIIFNCDIGGVDFIRRGLHNHGGDPYIHALAKVMARHKLCWSPTLREMRILVASPQGASHPLLEEVKRVEGELVEAARERLRLREGRPKDLTDGQAQQLKLLQAAVAKNPKNVKVHRELAKFYVTEAGSHSEAIVVLRNALNDCNDAAIELDLAELLADHQGDVDVAVRMMRAAAERCPRDRGVAKRVADFEKKHKDAIARLNQQGDASSVSWDSIKPAMSASGGEAPPQRAAGRRARR